MMSTKFVSKLSLTPLMCSRRHIGIMSPMLRKTSDPVQKLFLTKLQEYETAERSGKIVGDSKTREKIQNELDRISKQFGGESGVDITKFPSLKFEEPKVDPIGN